MLPTEICVLVMRVAGSLGGGSTRSKSGSREGGNVYLYLIINSNIEIQINAMSK